MAIFNITPQAIVSDVLTAQNIILGSSNVDVNAVLDQTTLKQVFADARPIKATIRETARVMNYPVETGAILSDHKIINPTEIEMIFAITSEFYASAYQAIRNAWKASTLLSVQARTGTYRNFVISDMPHEEEPDTFNMITQFVKFREVIYVAPASVAKNNGLSNFSPAAPQNTSLIERGLITAETTALSAASYLKAAKFLGR